MSGVIARCARLARPLFGFLLLVLAQAVLVEGGTLSAAVALAATAAVGSALAVCATLASRAVPVARTRVRTAIRDRERRTAFLPQRDPDASGRPRPRAPGRLALTAA
ncbi:DUF6412 domain-containing protein [Streptomyces sp. Edi4]|uniref:DUF6412 domain-containing protein n=1 Tax=Streptomyces sp. Edi4 TaxID=3162527 RepID=UPI003305B460